MIYEVIDDTAVIDATAVIDDNAVIVWELARGESVKANNPSLLSP